jgi:PAS domain S-box-containing protein
MSCPDSFIAFCDLSPEARILWVSPSGYDLLGYEPEDLIGKPGFEVIYPDEHADVHQFLAEYVQNDLIASQIAIRFVMKDGQQILCALLACVCYDLSVEVLKVQDPDVEKRKSADRFLALFVLMSTHDN